MWKLHCENLVWDYHEAIKFEEEPVFFRWRWMASLAGKVWVRKRPWGLATITQVKSTPALPQGDPYRRLPSTGLRPVCGALNS